MRLFEKFPRPWRIEHNYAVDAEMFAGGFTVFDACGETIIFGGTYTGDGDQEFNLNRLQVEELVNLVNAGIA